VDVAGIKMARGSEMISKKSTANPSQPPLVRGGASRHNFSRSSFVEGGKGGQLKSREVGRVEVGATLKSEVQPSSSPDKGRLGGVKAFVPYNKNLTLLARENRKNPTAPEIKMWNKVLRMRHFADYKFLRQKPIADFIVDFYCAELKLVIELDGDSHADAAVYDDLRTVTLNALGIAVVRYTNDEVIKNLDGVYDDLARAIEQIKVGIIEP
jgi:very-short-patch-repair endonuclease